jgi:hypothetical protein
MEIRSGKDGAERGASILCNAWRDLFMTFSEDAEPGHGKSSGAVEDALILRCPAALNDTRPL